MMTLSDSLALYIANAVADARDTGGAGSVRVYQGSVPASADTALTGQTDLSTVTLNSPGYDEAAMVGDIAVADISVSPSIPSASISVSDTATFARIRDGNGLVRSQVVFGDEITIADANLIAGDTLQIQ